MWQPRALLEWWFGPPGSLKAQIDAHHGLWFGKRDALLGRESSSEEPAFLRQPGLSL